MAVDRTLAKVDADLRSGEVAMARQRLQGLVVSFPDRLDLRERLADVCRRQGDLAQAGRWSYLGADREPREVAAFERAYPDAFARMKALHWRTDEDSAGAEAAARLRALREEAEAVAGAPVPWADPRRPEPRPTLGSRVAGWGCLLVGLAAGGLALVGLGSLVAIGFRTVMDWVR